MGSCYTADLQSQYGGAFDHGDVETFSFLNRTGGCSNINFNYTAGEDPEGLEVTIYHIGTDGGAFDAVTILTGDNLTPTYRCEFGAVFLDNYDEITVDDCKAL